MTGYEQFQQIMADLNYFCQNGVPRDPYHIKDKDGASILEDMFGDIFKKR